MEQLIKAIFAKADIQFNGNRAWDIQIKDNRLYRRIALKGALGLGEAYMDDWWECQSLDEFFARAMRANISKALALHPITLIDFFKQKLINLQSKKRAFIVGEEHYNIGNNLYKAMLDKRMVYTCGYWKNSNTLDQAQEAKLDLVCKKLNLKAGEKVLDIGCGWGSFACFAAKRYKVHVVGITIAQEQIEPARAFCKGLPVEIRLQDYRDINETFDHIVSLGMFEHVGYKNYREYMKVAERCLKENGLFLLQTMGQWKDAPNLDQQETVWMTKYIFPNGQLPSINQIGKAIEDLFVMEDWHNFRADYEKTMMAWFRNFDKYYPRLKDRYDERFYRMWKFYLHCFAGAFRSGKYELWQIVFSKKGIPSGYHSIR